ncbi:MAG: hypothetical protein LBF77_04455, partial [Spirochaetaceae bacterium]|nr:hypothetical protein [Spirochaetaceae bacterium]
IEIRLVNKITVGEYESEFDFNWHSADIKPEVQDGEFRGFNLGSYLDELGSGAAFEKVPAYLYISVPDSLGSGFGNSLTVSITGSGISSINDDDESRYSLVENNIKDEEGNPADLSAWFNNLKEVYDFTDTLNARSSQSIKYIVGYTGSMPIRREYIGENEKLIANLAVLLPMAFTLPGVEGEKFTVTGSGEYAGPYIPVKFQGLDDFLGSGGTGSGNSGGDSVMDQINKQLGGGGVKSLTLKLRDIKNNVTGDIYLAIAKRPGISDVGNQNPADWEIVKVVSGEADREIDIESTQSLTQLPPIKFLVREEGGQGRLYIQSQEDENSVAFSVKISVVADINLDKTIDL